jgi:hypothetical protein
MRIPASIGAAFFALAAPAAAQNHDAWAAGSKLGAARAEATTIVLAFMASVRQPRGSWGTCPADGAVLVFERGRLPHGGERVSVGVPCSTSLHDPAQPMRRIHMRFLHDRTFARLYFDAQGRLIDYEPLRLSPEPLPPGW